MLLGKPIHSVAYETLLMKISPTTCPGVVDAGGFALSATRQAGEPNATASPLDSFRPDRNAGVDTNDVQGKLAERT
jgi:hypothetical protein